MIQIKSKEQKTIQSSYQRESNTTFSAKRIKDDLDYMEDKIGKLEDKIENSKLSIIETLGIFVALFTFISIDFQIFRSYRNPVTVGALTAILIGSIFLFIIVFDYFILQARKVRKTEEKLDSKIYLEDRRASKARKILIGLSSLFIFGGLAIFFAVIPQEQDDNKEQTKKEILNLVQSDISNQNKDLKNINESNEKIIKDTNDKIGELKRCVRNFGVTYRCFE